LVHAFFNVVLTLNGFLYGVTTRTKFIVLFFFDMVKTEITKPKLYLPNIYKSFLGQILTGFPWIILDPIIMAIENIYLDSYNLVHKSVH
jgi:hypothetical protein